MKKLKLFFACLLMAVLSIGQVWADKITAVANIESGKQYYIGSTKSNSTDYYLQVTGRGATDGKVKGVAVTNLDDADVFTFTQTSGGWTIQFSNGKYLVLPNAKDNGKVYVQADAGDWTIANASSLLSLKYGDYYLQNNKATNTTNFGMYQSGQLDLWLEPVSSGDPDACAAPTFNPGAGSVVSGTAVTLSTNTEGATIYYTMGADPADPTTSSTQYNPENKPVISSATTIKAIAVKEGLDNSSVASASYTVVTPYTTIQDLFEAKTSTSTPVYVTFGGWKISGVKGGQAFLTDGTKGLIIYQSSHGFVVGDALTGTAACNLIAYKGAVELTGLTSTSTGLTVTHGSMSDAVAKTIDELGAVNTSALVTISNVTYDGTNLSDGTNSIKPYNGLFSSMSFENGKKYNVTGVLNYYDALQIMPRSAADIVEVVEEGAPANPTFSPAAGTYTSVQSVEISCETEGATIYYTTDGSTPTNESTVYASAIEVGADMTIKAIAVKNEKPSGVATADYTINLPVSEEDQKTWNLAIDETATASENELTWTATYVSMSFAKASAGTNANNYYPGTSGQSYTSTRTYKNSVITITPNGKQITSIVFEATSSGYATALKNSAWTNATAVADNTTITVTPTNGKNAISAVIVGTCGFTSVQVNYEAISATAPADPTFSVAAGEYTEVKSVELSCETDGATIYYTTDGSTPNNTSTEYTAAITVDENMTIKAIAYLGEEASGVAEAAYVINLPVSEEDQKTWDLSIDETATASADALTWTATYVDMSVTSGTAAANNYYPGTSGKSYTSTRFYNGATLTITPNGKQITSIVIETDGATPFKNATWTNGTATNVDKTVTITVTSPGAVTAVFQANATAFSVQVNYTAIDPTFPVAPTFSVEGGTYTSAQSVELSCETVGATIYYTTDGTAPSSTSTEYTSAIPVNEDMTIKAVAINGEKVGPIVTQVYKINLPLTTMDAILTRATAIGSTADEVLITFNNWVVSGVSTDGKNVYVTDGSKGFIIYNANGESGFEVNDKLNGTVTCDLKLYAKVAEVVDLKANAEGLTVTKDGVVNPVAANIANLGAVNTGAPIILSNVKFDGTDFVDANDNTIKPYNTLFAYEALTTNKYYNITGIYVHYNNNKEVAPRSADDIELIADKEAPAMQWYVSSTKEEAINASHIIRVGDTFAPFFETNSEGAKTYSSSDATIAEIDENTGALTLKGEVGSTTITCAVAADDVNNLLADSKSFTLQVKAQPTVDNVVIVAFVNDKWYALQNVAGTTSGSLLGVEVNYSENKIWDLPAAEQAAITWKRTVDGADVTFQDGYNNYLKGTTSGAALTLDANVHNWNWYADGGYYRIGESARTFFVNYVANDDENIFKNFATSNLNKTNYSGLAVVTAAVFDVTPEPPTKDLIRGGLSNGKWGTLCPKQNVENVEGAEFFLLSFLEEKDGLPYNVVFDQIEGPNLQAGKPYFFIANAEEIRGNKTGEPLDAAGAGVNGFYGYIGANSMELTVWHDAYDEDEDNTFVIHDNKVVRINQPGTMLPSERCYININKEVPSRTAVAKTYGRRRITVGVSGTNAAQGFENLDASEKPLKVMIEGTLYILRGEKVYDATGRLVK